MNLHGLQSMVLLSFSKLIPAHHFKIIPRLNKMTVPKANSSVTLAD